MARPAAGLGRLSFWHKNMHQKVKGSMSSGVLPCQLETYDNTKHHL